MSVRKFTVVELLVVISVIGVLAGLLLPALMSANDKAKETKAASECNTIATALKQYEATYMKMPNISTVNNTTFIGGKKYDSSPDSNYTSLIEALVGTNMAGSASFGTINPRKIRFLEAGSSYTTKGFVNPWDYQYYVLYDTTGTGKLDITFPTSSKTATILGSVAVFSSVNPNTTDFQKGLKFATSWEGILKFK